MSSDIKTTWLNNSKKPAKYNTDYEGETNIIRLVEDPSIVKNIQFDEISIPIEYETVGGEGSEPVLENEGSFYPVIRINDAIIAKADIKSMEIRSSGFIPTISLTLSFPTSEFVSRHTPKDGDMISTFICLNTTALNYLRNDFIITSCTTTMSANKASNKVVLTGRMFVHKLESTQDTFGVIGTSKDVAKEIAKRYSLGFSYNDPDDMDDFMDWICCNQTPVEFFEEVISHSWKNGETWFKSWIDLYYDLCFVNVNKFLLSTENTEKEIDRTFAATSIALNEVQKDRNNYPQKCVKIISNAKNFKGTVFYIKKWKPVNNSTSISMNVGYETDSITFAHNQEVYNNDSNDCFDTAQNFPAYDTTKYQTHILLRGRGKWEEGVNPKDDLKRQNYDLVHQYVINKWAGVEYVMGEEDKKIKDNTQWSGNVHKNYGHAPLHNNINNAELNKIYLEVELEGLCLQIMRGERIPVYIVYQNLIDTAINNNIKNDDVSSSTNKFYSGFYIVDAISYKYKPSETVMTSYTTVLTLKRREWPTPEPTVGEEMYDQGENDI